MTTNDKGKLLRGANTTEQEHIQNHIDKLAKMNAGKEIKAMVCFSLTSDDSVYTIQYATPVEGTALLAAIGDYVESINQSLYSSFRRDWRGGLFELLMMTGGDDDTRLDQILGFLEEDEREDAKELIDMMQRMGTIRLLTAGTLAPEDVPEKIAKQLTEAGISPHEVVERILETRKRNLKNEKLH